MFDSLKNLVDAILASPEKLSRVVFASILIVALCAFTFDFGKNLVPRYFAGDVGEASYGVAPLTPAEASTVNAGKTPEALSADVQACKANRSNQKAEAFLKSFGASFNGILPGTGDLLREHAGMVNGRREKLIMEVMQRYANLKFCLDKETFKLLHLEGYRTVIQNLDTYKQTRGWENSGKQDNPGMTQDKAIKELGIIQKDLVDTEIYVTKTIDGATESAKTADQQTAATISSLGNETNSKLIDRTNSLLANLNDISNVQTRVLGNHSLLLNEISRLLAYQNAGKVSSGKIPYFTGSSLASQIEWKDIPSYTEPDVGEQIDLKLPETTGLVAVVNQANSEINNSQNGNLYAYGVLNLVDNFTRANFLALNFKKAILLYTAAQNNFDPYAPRAGFLTGANTLSNPPDAVVVSQICQSIDDPSATCFGV